MTDLTCFGETSVQIADAASSSGMVTGGGGGSSAARSQSRVTCLYHARLAERRPHGAPPPRSAGVVIAVDDCASWECLCRANVRPWLFSKRSKGYKTLDVGAATATLGGARFNAGRPEPLDGLYVARGGDGAPTRRHGEAAYRRTGVRAGRPDVPGRLDVDEALLVARREHVVGRNVYAEVFAVMS